MDMFNAPIDKDQQLKKIIEDTEEILFNFRQISGIIVDRLGNKLANYQEDNEDLSEIPYKIKK